MENDVWQIPTLSIMTAISKRQFLRDDYQATFDLLPKEVGSGWKKRSASVAESAPSPAFQRYSDWVLDMTGSIYESDIPIMAGTDCPIFFLTPGYSLHEELSLLVEAGLTPLEAIRASTLRPAEYFEMDDHLGKIKTEYEADLVLLDANPLEDIRNTLKINTVIRAGEVYGKDKLKEIRNRLVDK